MGIVGCQGTNDASINSNSPTEAGLLSGKVLDGAGTPLKNVVVSLPRLHLIDTTDQDGLWCLGPASTSVGATPLPGDSVVYAINGQAIQSVAIKNWHDILPTLTLLETKISGWIDTGSTTLLWPGRPTRLNLVTRSQKTGILRTVPVALTWKHFSRLLWLPDLLQGDTLVMRMEYVDSLGTVVGTSMTVRIQNRFPDSIEFGAIQPRGGFRPPPSFVIQWLCPANPNLERFTFHGVLSAHNGERLDSITWDYNGTKVGVGDTLVWKRPDPAVWSATLGATAHLAGGDSMIAYTDLPQWGSANWLRIDSSKQNATKDSLLVFWTENPDTMAPRIVSRRAQIQGRTIPLDRSNPYRLPLDLSQPFSVPYTIEIADVKRDTIRREENFDLPPDLHFDSIQGTPENVRIVVGGRSLLTLLHGTINGLCSLETSRVCDIPRGDWNSRWTVELFATWPGSSWSFVRIDTTVDLPPYKLDFRESQRPAANQSPDWDRFNEQVVSWSDSVPMVTFNAKVRPGVRLAKNVLGADWTHSGTTAFGNFVELGYDFWRSKEIRVSLASDASDAFLQVMSIDSMEIFPVSYGWIRGWRIPKNAQGTFTFSPDSMDWFQAPVNPGVETMTSRPTNDVVAFRQILAGDFKLRIVQICGNSTTDCNTPSGSLEIGSIESLLLETTP